MWGKTTANLTVRRFFGHLWRPFSMCGHAHVHSHMFRPTGMETEGRDGEWTHTDILFKPKT